MESKDVGPPEFMATIKSSTMLAKIKEPPHAMGLSPSEILTGQAGIQLPRQNSSDQSTSAMV